MRRGWKRREIDNPSDWKKVSLDLDWHKRGVDFSRFKVGVNFLRDFN